MAQSEEKQSVISTKLAETTYNSVQFNVNIEGNKNMRKQYDCCIKCNAEYNGKEKIENIIDAIVQYINGRFPSVHFRIYCIRPLFIASVDHNSFIHEAMWFDNKGYKDLVNKPITAYTKSNIEKNGLTVELMAYHEYEVTAQPITCEHMISGNSINPLLCPIYYSMKKEKKFNCENLQHLTKYRHLQDALMQKPECRYNQQCKSYGNVNNGGYDIYDRCHMKLYRHPPRAEMITLQQNINSFVLNKKKQENHKVYLPSLVEKDIYKFDDYDGFLLALIDEMISNKFKYDLCLLCSELDECKHNVYKNNSQTLLSIVNEKMQCEQHKVRGSPLTTAQMLSLIIYTGCGANYDLCKSQRGGDYKKWKWLDYCLYWAIFLLSSSESGLFSVFSGLNQVQLNSKSVDAGFFVTYVSTSWNKDVAQRFMGKKGMLINFDESFKNAYRVKCCDVTWISKFEDECEILFARHEREYFFDEGFKCEVLDDCGGVQIVSLFKRIPK